MPDPLAYYNEIDPYAAQWLRNLIDDGQIAPGVVDQRSIDEVRPGDLEGFTQCHFFSGIGVWSLALRRAGWGDDRPVWTGSCPCQPFSTAGKGAGFDDERHLWPAFHHLIAQRRPPVVIGEQVASKDADPWIDLVCADVEALGYAFGAVPFPSAGIGAPHIRDRVYWVALADRGAGRKRRAGGMGDAHHQGLEGRTGNGGAAQWRRPERPVAEAGVSRWVADCDQHGCPASPLDRGDNHKHHLEPCGESSGVGNADRLGARGDSGGLCRPLEHVYWQQRAHDAGPSGSFGSLVGRTCDPEHAAGPVNGLWRAADWLFCRDGRWRPVEPGTSPVAHGAPARVGRLRAYGNAINAEAACAFIEGVMDFRRRS